MPTFPAPPDFSPPDGVEDGQDFDVVATFSLSNGQLTLKAIEGTPVGGDSDPDAEKEGAEPSAPSEGSEGEGGGFLSAVEKRTGGS